MAFGLFFLERERKELVRGESGTWGAGEACTFERMSWGRYMRWQERGEKCSIKTFWKVKK